ncbi:DUF3429 domain-containing protein [Gammaproteobacteria bacterium]|nr:DUF3429 domain-containing protein [Gammaproteobacteria bacterium]
MNGNSTTYTSMPHALIYAGSLPFIAGAMFMLAGIQSLPLLGDVVNSMATYGLVISVFLTGIHWGQELSLGRAVPGLFIASNIIALTLWIGWLVLPEVYFLPFLTIPLLVILAIDHNLFKLGVVDNLYFRSRIIITVIVIFCLFVTAALI